MLLQALIFGRAIMDAMRRNARRTGISIVRTSTTTSHCRPKRIHSSTLMAGRGQKRNELIDRWGGTSIRQHFATTTDDRSSEPLAQLLVDEQWSPVYRYSMAPYWVLLARLKTVQTLITVLLLPYTAYQFMLGNASMTLLIGTTGMTLLAVIMLAASIRFFNRIVGVISINATNEFVRIGYVSFFGNRANRYASIDDIMQLNEIDQNINRRGFFVKLQQYSTPKHLYLRTAHIDIVDVTRARLIFGDDLSMLGVEHRKAE